VVGGTVKPAAGGAGSDDLRAATSATAAGSAALAGDGGRGDSGLTVGAEHRITLLVRRWRAHFLRAVRPVAMPPGWDVRYAVIGTGHRTADKLEHPLVREAMAALD
jgi:hypothetical protein